LFHRHLVVDRRQTFERNGDALRPGGSLDERNNTRAGTRTAASCGRLDHNTGNVLTGTPTIVARAEQRELSPIH
jgi:hypothetical protein